MGHKWSASDALTSQRLNRTGASILKIQAGEAIDTSSVPKAGYIGTDGKAYYSNASSAAEAKCDFVILYGQNVSSGTDIYVVKSGYVPDFSGLTRGDQLFVGNTDGLIQNTSGTWTVPVGSVLSATEINVDKYSRLDNLVRGFSLVIADSSSGVNAGRDNIPCGYSDASDPIISLASQYIAAGGGVLMGDVRSTKLFGIQPFVSAKTVYSGVGSNTILGCVKIDADIWHCTAASFLKNNSSIAFSGTARYGVLGHDVANSRMLVLYASDKVAKFSGLGLTTLTNLSSDVTLDTAVSTTKGFAYDDTDDTYIFLDTTNNVVRRFNSSGVTIETWSYGSTISEGLMIGVTIIDGRVYIVFQTSACTANTPPSSNTLSVQFVPTGMVI